MYYFKSMLMILALIFEECIYICIYFYDKLNSQIKCPFFSLHSFEDFGVGIAEHLVSDLER